MFVRPASTGTITPACATKIPHPGKQHIGIYRIERDSRAPGRKIAAFQNQLPRLAAVGCLVEAAVRRIAPERPGHRRENSVAVFCTNENLSDSLGLLQTRVYPGLTAVGRFVNAVSDRNAVARPRFARAHPDIFAVLWIERDGADRLHGLLVKHRPV